MIHMDKYSKEEQERALARKFDLGEGINITFGDGDKVNYFFTNKVEGIKMSTKKVFGLLEVEMSSSQVDDEQLLKKLHMSL